MNSSGRPGLCSFTGALFALGLGGLFFLAEAGWLPKGLAPPCRAAEAGERAATPPPGSPERRLILAALREELFRLHGLEMVFEVRHLKVRGEWAWVAVSPRSPDGRRHYEPVHALLRKQGGRWQVAELPCTEEESPLWQPGYFRQLQTRFPGVPPGIFPEQLPGAP